MSRERLSAIDKIIEKMASDKPVTDRDMTKLEYEQLGIKPGFIRRVLNIGPTIEEKTRGIYTDSC